MPLLIRNKNLRHSLFLIQSSKSLLFVSKAIALSVPFAKAELKLQCEDVPLFPDLIISAVERVFCKTNKAQS